MLCDIRTRILSLASLSRLFCVVACVRAAFSGQIIFHYMESPCFYLFIHHIDGCLSGSFLGPL